MLPEDLDSEISYSNSKITPALLKPVMVSKKPILTLNKDFFLSFCKNVSGRSIFSNELWIHFLNFNSTKLLGDS